MLNPSLLAFLGQPTPPGGPTPMTPISTPRAMPLAPVPSIGPVATPPVARMTPPRQPSRMTRFLNAILPPPDANTAALLGEDGVRGAQRQALLTLGASLLSNSGWTDRPVPLSQALGQGVLAAQQSYQQQIGTGVQNVIASEQARALAEQRAAIGEANRALAEERRFELAEVKRLAAGRPGFYGEFMRGFDQLPPDQQKARLIAMNNKALAEGDTTTAQRLTAMLASGNLFATPKGIELEVKQNITGRDVAINPITGEIVKDYGPAQRMAGGGGGGNDRPPGVVSAIGRINAQVRKFNDVTARAQRVLVIENLPDNQITGTKTVAAMYSFVQGLDESTVKEGERAMIQSADPILQRVGQWLSLNNVRFGQQLSPAMARELAKEIRIGLEERRNQLQLDLRADRGFVERGMPEYPIDQLQLMQVAPQPGSPAMRGAQGTTPRAASPASTAGTPPAGLNDAAAARRARLGGP